MAIAFVIIPEGSRADGHYQIAVHIFFKARIWNIGF
jgi:hypothetical protein